MRKLLKKRLSFFGKEVSVFMLVLIGFGILGTAALVPYLSNTLFADVNVESPMQCWFEDVEGNNLGVTNPTINIAGDEPITLYTRCIGKGPVEAYGIMLNVEGPSDWSGEEFQSVNLKEKHGDGDVTDKGDILPYLFHVESEASITPFASVSGSDEVNLFASRPNEGETLGDADTFLDSYDEDTNIWNEITIVPKVNIHPGRYTIDMCYVADLDNPSCEGTA